MVAKKRRGQPAPAPVGEVAKRLEQVRAKRRVETLLEFHRRVLNEGYEVSYSAIRNFHYDRDPPLGYLRAVSDAFSVRLGWLAAGEGEMEFDSGGRRDAAVAAFMSTHAGEDFRRTLANIPRAVRQRLEAGIERGFPAYADLPDSLRRMIGETGVGTLTDCMLGSAEFGADLESVPVAEGFGLIGEAFGKYLSGPFSELGIDPSGYGPVEWALTIEALLRPIEVASRGRTAS